MSAYAMLTDSSLPVLKSKCPKPSFSLPSKSVVSSVIAAKTTAPVKSPASNVSAPPTIIKTPSTNKVGKKCINNNDIDIAVKSANVDCKRYIAATSKSRRRSRLASVPSEKSKNDSSLWEEAVEFEISISFNGYTYTRSRSFPRIVRLRNEIAKEIGSRKKKCSTARFPVIRSLVDDAASTCITSGYYGQQKQHKPNHLNDDIATVSLCDVMGLSLTMMQSALNGRSCPAIETWLQSVSSELIDPRASPSLTDFLKEDTASEPSAVTKSKRWSKRKCQQPSQLWSIQEDRPCMDKDSVVCRDNRETDVVDDEPSSSCMHNIDSHHTRAISDEDNECDAYYSAM